MHRTSPGMSKSIVISMALFGLFSVSSSLFAQHTYYISKSSGSDGNSSSAAQSKSTPWAHLPGMPSCTASCAGYTPVAGDQFILKGGDTWVASDLGIGWAWSGTAGARIYIGVDPTWYSGSYWTRPVFTFGGGYGGGSGLHVTNMWYSGAQYFTVDNIEFTGFGTSNKVGGNIVYGYGQNQEFEHLYIHGWKHSSSGDGDNGQVFGFGGMPVNGSAIHDCVVDGSDTTKDMMAAFIGNIPNAYNNIILYVSNGFEATGDNWHDNFVGPIGQSFSSGAHQNAMFNFGPAYASTMVLYNNVITGTVGSICGSVCGGIVKLWLTGNEVTTATGYAFNNVLYNNSTGNYINLGSHGATTYGTWYFFNNTVECGSDTTTQQCFGDAGAPSGELVTFHSMNNHWISNNSPAVACSVFTCTSTSDVLQTVSAASSQGYKSSVTMAFSPSGTGATSGAGTNLQSVCSAIGQTNSAAGTACQSSTGYACSYNTSNHSVSCPAATLSARPGSGAWDAGAYQGAVAVQPASGVTATPH